MPVDNPSVVEVLKQIQEVLQKLLEAAESMDRKTKEPK